MQKKAVAVLKAMLKRDQTALNPKKTSAISTRTLILDDPAAAAGSRPKADAANALITALTANLNSKVFK